MKREILFRGIEIESEKWIEGELTGNVIHVQSPWCEEGYSEWWGYKVHFNTIGQYTGLNDKNGARIFEGDKVRVFIKGAWFETDVVWGIKSHGWSLKCDRTNEKFGVIKYYSLPHSKYIEVTGNIHDNG